MHFPLSQKACQSNTWARTNTKLLIYLLLLPPVWDIFPVIALLLEPLWRLRIIITIHRILSTVTAQPQETAIHFAPYVKAARKALTEFVERVVTTLPLLCDDSFPECGGAISNTDGWSACGQLLLTLLLACFALLACSPNTQHITPIHSHRDNDISSVLIIAFFC